MFGCSSNKPNDEKQLIGFTIYEKNTQIGKSQKVNNLNDITNGFYTTRDHTATSFIGESYFNIKIDTSTLPGDLITPESNCLFVNASYYQAYTVNYKLFIYSYLFNDLVMLFFSNRFFQTTLDAPFIKLFILSSIDAIISLNFACFSFSSSTF